MKESHQRHSLRRITFFMDEREILIGKERKIVGRRNKKEGSATRGI